MDSPRVWSRDDFERAFEIAGSSINRALKILEFCEQNAVLQIAQPRDESGRFARKPELHFDSPIVVTARAGG